MRVNQNPGYKAFDEAGQQVYPKEKEITGSAATSFSKQDKAVPFKVKVSADDLNIRIGPGTNYRKNGKHTG